MQKLCDFMEFMIYDIPPGPHVLPMRSYANLHKGSMFFYILFLMWYYDNYSMGAYLYLALHGSYGFFWLLRDYTFPDPGFLRKVTIVSWLMPWPIALLPYMMIPYWMVSENVQVSNERMFVAIMLYVNGIVLMMLTDGQKYLVLRERKGLITHAMHGWSRNMNYVGEITLYASFAVLCQKWEVWFIYAYMWGIVFPTRMFCKDYSLSKKEGWHNYAKQTWILIPKIMNSDVISYIIYGVAFSVAYLTYESGGIEVTLKSLF